MSEALTRSLSHPNTTTRLSMTPISKALVRGLASAFHSHTFPHSQKQEARFVCAKPSPFTPNIGSPPQAVSPPQAHDSQQQQNSGSPSERWMRGDLLVGRQHSVCACSWGSDSLSLLFSHTSACPDVVCFFCVPHLHPSKAHPCCMRAPGSRWLQIPTPTPQTRDMHNSSALFPCNTAVGRCFPVSTAGVYKVRHAHACVHM